MNELCINTIPRSILERLFKLKEFEMFILPKGYIISNKYLNNWRDILNKKLYKVFARHEAIINVYITTFDICTKAICYDDITIKTQNLIEVLIGNLNRNIAVSLIINNYTNRYGYLIIPGYQITCDKINIYDLLY